MFNRTLKNLTSGLLLLTAALLAESFHTSSHADTVSPTRCTFGYHDFPFVGPDGRPRADVHYCAMVMDLTKHAYLWKNSRRKMEKNAPTIAAVRTAIGVAEDTGCPDWSNFVFHRLEIAERGAIPLVANGRHIGQGITKIRLLYSCSTGFIQN